MKIFCTFPDPNQDLSLSHTNPQWTAFRTLAYLTLTRSGRHTLLDELDPDLQKKWAICQNALHWLIILSDEFQRGDFKYDNSLFKN